MFKHTTTSILAAAIAAAALAVLAGPSAGASGVPITTCGQTVTTNAVLTQDLTCAGHGIVIGASGITVDLNGHVLKGNHSLGPNGIDGGFGYDVTIKNGVIRNFDDGVFVAGGVADVSISNVVATGNVRGGIVVAGDRVSINNSAASGNGTVGIETWGKVSVRVTTAAGNGTHGIWLRTGESSIRSSTALGNGSAGFVLEGNSNSVISSTTSGNGWDGIYVKGNGASVKSTKASGNADKGIEVSGDSAVLSGNRAEANGFAGGASDGLGDGIFVNSLAIAPTGKNIARGNDDSAECQPSSLCPAAGSSAKAPTAITACGQTVTTSAVLAHDLNCPGSDGIKVASSGITIDLNGHVLSGNGGGWGISQACACSNMTIKNGVVRNFAYGVVFFNADDVTLSSVVAAGNFHEGVYMIGASALIKSSTVSGNGGAGIHIDGDSASITSSSAAGNGSFGVYVAGDGTAVKSSTAAGNGQTGFSIGGASTSVTSSTASGNGWWGIDVLGGFASVKSSKASGNSWGGIHLSSDAATLTGNTADGNGYPGGSSDLAGLGILVENYTTTPTGTNVVRGNDDPAKCHPSSLC